MNYLTPEPSFRLTMEIRSHALSIAKPAPCAKLGAVALAASPMMRILFFFEAQGKEATSLILRISVLSILSAGVC